MKSYLTHAKMCYAQAFDSGLLYSLGGYAMRFARLIILLTLWRGILSAEHAFNTDDILAYTFWASVLGEQLNIRTPLSEDFWRGDGHMRYLRPMPVLLQVMVETMGRWLPGLLAYSLPMIALSFPLGIPIMPATAERGIITILSLTMTISLGFALDYIFTALALRLHNTSYQAKLLRDAFSLVCTGSLIPFQVMPWGIGDILALTPFGALAGAPLSIWAGLGNVPTILAAQVIWNALCWPFALWAYHKSEEKLVMHGG